MTVLVFGQTGQVATELASLPGTLCLPRAAADLSNPATCADAIAQHQPQAVINAAAFTDVDGAEPNEAMATRINAHAPGAMAQTCAALGIPFVHISTDYVFDGSGTRPWHPNDPTRPLSAYGRSKLAGEIAVRAAGGPHAILRTSWVVSPHGSNFVKTMHRLGATHNNLSVVFDQVGGLTPARDIANACVTIAKSLLSSPEKSGTYHLSGTPDASWADIARAVMAAAGHPCKITDIPSADYPTLARRPLNSRLDCSDLMSKFTIARPQWHASLTEIIAHEGRNI